MGLKNSIKQAINVFFFLTSCLIKKKKNRIVFGAWFGDRYGDNPRFLMEWLAATHPGEFELVWIGNHSVFEQIPETKEIKFIQKNSPLAMLYAATAKYAFFSHSHTDISNLNIFGNCTTVQLWHGIPLKRIGDDAIGFESYNGIFSRIKKNKMDNYSFYVASSNENAEKLLSAFQSFSITKEKILSIGQPRNDFLLEQKEYSSSYKKKLYKLLPGTEGKCIITYMPTFRDKTENNFSFSQLKGESKKKLEAVLKKHNAVILEKSHYAASHALDGKESSKFLYSLNDIPVDTQELLVATDLLITDYSSCYFDFLLLDRPIIHYAYDYQTYGSVDRGFYYRLEEVSGGSIITLEGQLADSIDQNLSEPDLHRNERLKTISFLLTDEKEKSRQDIYEEILKKD